MAGFVVVDGFFTCGIGDDLIDKSLDGIGIIFLDDAELLSDGLGIFMVHFGVEEFEEDLLGGGGGEFFISIHGGEVEELLGGREVVV